MGDNAKYLKNHIVALAPEIHVLFDKYRQHITSPLYIEKQLNSHVFYYL
jgi:hypothetical protein